MLAYYGTQLSPHMEETPEGYLICRDVPIARTGEMTYLSSELGLEGPDRPVTVYRDPADVFDPDALASFEGKDVTSGHPAENVGPVNHAAYSRGHVQDVRREGNFVIADLLVKDACLISDIRNGVVREVSCGYNCVYTPLADGRYKQTGIRGNHVAVVPRGRAGREVAIQDSAASAGKGTKRMSKFAEAILKAFGTAAQEAETPEGVEALIPTAAAALDAEPAGVPGAPAQETVPAALDALPAKLDRLIDLLEARASQPEKKISDEKDLDAVIEKLGGGEPEDKEKAADAPADGVSNLGTASKDADAATALLKAVRPAVAGIKDEQDRARVVDALLSSIKGPNVMGRVMEAAEANARQAADAAQASAFESRCQESEADYAARNPHKKKED